MVKGGDWAFGCQLVDEACAQLPGLAAPPRVFTPMVLTDTGGNYPNPSSARGSVGTELHEPSRIAEQLYERTAPPEPDDGTGPADDDGFTDRKVWLDLHYQGAGKLTGDLTPECAAALTALLDALGKKAGPEDDRTQAQRHHDALEEACRRLIAAGCVPQ